MTLKHRKLVTVVTEAALEHELVRKIERLGAHGYTITDARGKGGRGIRNAGWDLSANIRIEVVCAADTALAIAAAFRERYYDNYGMILFIGDVEVLRPEKFWQLRRKSRGLSSASSWAPAAWVRSGT